MYAFFTDVGIDIQDDLGRHEVGFVDNTEKTPIGNNQEGCIFHSTFFINKVPGNFHISTHSSHKQPDDPDFSHKIKEIKLGDQIIANIPGSFNPLAGVAKNTELGNLKITRLNYTGECYRMCTNLVLTNLFQVLNLMITS